MRDAGFSCAGKSRRGGALALLLLIAVGPAVVEGQTPGSGAIEPTASDLGLATFSAPLRPDTLLHALGGAMSGFFAASIVSETHSASFLRIYPLFLPAVGASAALVAGIGKETLDSTGFGDPQWSDIVHTLIGGMLASGFIAAVDSSGRDPTFLLAAGLCFALPVSAAFAKEIEHYLKKRGQR